MALNIALIRESFAAARPHTGKIVEQFYHNLWRDFPASQALFEHVDQELQKTALGASLGFIVDHLDKPEQLTRYLRSLGARHARYGVEAEHYVMVGQSLLKTFAEAFGQDWTSELAEHWQSAYQFVADTMQAGARESRESGAARVSGDNQPLRPSGLTVNLSFELPQEVRQEIRKIVRAAVREAVLEEVQTALREELDELSRQQSSQFLKKSA